jgi:hypothetical protein
MTKQETKLSKPKGDKLVKEGKKGRKVLFKRQMVFLAHALPEREVWQTATFIDL